MNRFTVLATGPSGPVEEFEPLKAAGLDLVIGRLLDAQGRKPWSEADLIEAVRAADVVLASHLELMSRPVHSPTPENFVAVAEATVALILMLQKRVKHNEAKLRSGAWAQRDDRGEFLFGKTVGLVGLGRVGSRVARRLAGWDVRLLASDPYVDPARARELDVTLVDLPTLLAESDVVSLHPWLTDETRRMIGEKERARSVASTPSA